MLAQGHLSISQAAAYAGVSRHTIRRRIADGTLPAVRVGPRIIRIRPQDLDRLIKPIPTAHRPHDPRDPGHQGGADRA